MANYTLKKKGGGQTVSKTVILVFDIDGTLAQHEAGNNPLDKFIPKERMVQLAKYAQRPEVGRMAIVTARPEASRALTEKWIREQGLVPEFVLMRAEGDTRPDSEVRVDQVKECQRRLGNGLILYDDKLPNCKAVEAALGVPCIHIE